MSDKIAVEQFTTSDPNGLTRDGNVGQTLVKIDTIVQQKGAIAVKEVDRIDVIS